MPLNDRRNNPHEVSFKRCPDDRFHLNMQIHYTSRSFTSNPFPIHNLSLGIKTIILRSIFLLLVLISTRGIAQIRVSIATDISFVRNFSPEQEFWAIGQTVQGGFHFSKRETGYVWMNYFINGKFSNDRIATSKSGTAPDTIAYTAKSIWNPREFSIGLKHYWKGSFADETQWNLYSITGFGINWTNVETSFTPSFDTAHYGYHTPIYGSGKFTKLTLDLGIGAEMSVGGNFFVYSDVRLALPASHYPSPWTANNTNVPLPLMIGFGARILFGY
jgi:hypothetical protein